MMDVVLMVLLCCFTGILARPEINRIIRESNSEGNKLSKGDDREFPTLLESPDMFHLPKPFSLDDKIAISVEINGTERLSISFVTDQNATEASTVFTVVADLESCEFTLHHNNNITLITKQKDLFVKEKIFKAKFERKEDPTTQESNILFIENFDYTDITSMDKIRYIKISGDKIKVKELNFMFA